MSWKTEYKRAVARALIKHGEEHDWGGSVYSSYTSFDPSNKTDVLNHLESCGYEKVLIEDIGWSEFAGTFTDDQQKHAISATIVCPCGKYYDYEGTNWYDQEEFRADKGVLTYRLEHNFGELLFNVLKEADE